MLVAAPRSDAVFLHSSETNCLPRSLVKVDGTPCRETQWYKNARAHVNAEMSLSGMASGHSVKRSTIVNRWVNPCDVGNGPTKSTCRLSNRLVGIGSGVSGPTMCFDTFACWQATHVRVHCRMSLAIPCQMKRSQI